MFLLVIRMSDQTDIKGRIATSLIFALNKKEVKLYLNFLKIYIYFISLQQQAESSRVNLNALLTYVWSDEDERWISLVLPPAQILDGSAARISIQDFFRIWGDEQRGIRDLITTTALFSAASQQISDVAGELDAPTRRKIVSVDSFHFNSGAVIWNNKMISGHLFILICALQMYLCLLLSRNIQTVNLKMKKTDSWPTAPLTRMRRNSFQFALNLFQMTVSCATFNSAQRIPVTTNASR